MSERNASIQEIRERLTGLLADWGSEFSSVLKELEEQRAQLAELKDPEGGRNGELEALQRRLEGQETLIEALRADAEEASKLRNELRGRELEFERVNSELESKKELIRALRREADGADRLKADAKLRDREMEQLQEKVSQAEKRAEDLTSELESLRETTRSKESVEASEIESLKSELEARKTLIKSMRGDQERVATLQATLNEKREIIEQLENSINRHSNTIAELRRSVEGWKRRYNAMKGESAAGATSVSLPTLSDTDVRVIERIEQASGNKPEATIAIDMRRSLLEARRTSQSNGEK
jgi:chromosome segregation ATPase